METVDEGKGGTVQVRTGVRELTPMRLRRDLDRVRHAIRMPTSGPRMLPDALIIGAQRCGTGSLYQYLCAHPSIVRSLRKETGDLAPARSSLEPGGILAGFPAAFARTRPPAHSGRSVRARGRPSQWRSP